MQVLRVDPATYLPTAVIDGYTSMIWTERYRDPGEFIMKTPRVSELRTSLALGRFITLLDSTETMIVESHSITTADDGTQELTITGRDLGSFLENRRLDGAYGKHYAMIKGEKSYTPQVAGLILLWNSFANNSGWDATHKSGFSKNSLDVIPNSIISLSMSTNGVSKRRWLEGGIVYDQFIKILAKGDIGYRTICPNSVVPGRSVTVSSSQTGDRGTVTYTTIPGGVSTALRFDLFSGTDRTFDQTAVTPVIFDYDSGDVLRPEYLFSIKDYKTAVVVRNGTDQYVAAYQRDSYSGAQGWDRRIGVTDAGDPDASEDATAWASDLVEFGNDYLLDHVRTNLVTAEIAPDASQTYGVDYFLGDTVTVRSSQFNLNQDMQVTEYVRSEDLTSDIGYPGLKIPGSTET